MAWLARGTWKEKGHLVRSGTQWAWVSVSLLHEQEKHHGATGPDHEGKKHGIRGGPQVDTACFRSRG